MSEFSESETQVDVGNNVFPVHMLDDAKGVREMSIVWMFRFNDALDAEMLHSSLARLISIGDWRKLGGSLRLKVCIKLMWPYLVEFRPNWNTRRTDSWRYTFRTNSPQSIQPLDIPTRYSTC